MNNNLTYMNEDAKFYDKCIGQIHPYVLHLIKWAHQPEYQSTSWLSPIRNGLKELYNTKTNHKNDWNKFINKADMDRIYIRARSAAIDEMKAHRYLEVPLMRDVNIYNFDFLSDPEKMQLYIDSLPCPKNIPHIILPQKYKR